MVFRNYCANCHVEMTPKRNGVYLVHFINNNESEGIDELQQGDLWECCLCGTQIVAGLARNSRLGMDIKNGSKLIKLLRQRKLLYEVQR